MTQCSNPIQCQLAKREECSCNCQGENHGKLLTGLTSSDPEVVAQAQKDLMELRANQAKLKKEKSTARRKRRALLRKTANQEVE